MVWRLFFSHPTTRNQLEDEWNLFWGQKDLIGRCYRSPSTHPPGMLKLGSMVGKWDNSWLINWTYTLGLQPNDWTSSTFLDMPVAVLILSECFFGYKLKCLWQNCAFITTRHAATSMSAFQTCRGSFFLRLWSSICCSSYQVHGNLSHPSVRKQGLSKNKNHHDPFIIP